MKIPGDAIIPKEKITGYLLVLQEANDKSNFLAQAGFTSENPKELTTAIRNQSQKNEAIKQKENKFGTFYEVKGYLEGVNELNLFVATIWLEKVDKNFQFITLKPSKEI